jgi:hypothetical protein
LSVESSVSQPSAAWWLQSANPAAQWLLHAPVTQVASTFGAAGQATPHAPQVATEERSASHPSLASALQSAHPVAQVPVAHPPATHAPAPWLGAQRSHVGPAHP